MSKQEVASGAADHEDHRHPGRPRGPDTDDAILRATVELLAEAGLRKTTIAAVAERAGVARATIYLRWASRDKLIAAAARHALGRAPFRLSRDLAADIRLGGQEARQVLGQPGFLAIFPEIVRGLMAEEPEMSYDDIAPNRRVMARQYVELCVAAGFRSDIAPTIAFDLLIGSQINHILATGRPPTPEVADQMTQVILAGLRAPARSA
jgi:AcrR family transcriptional regulator